MHTQSLSARPFSRSLVVGLAVAVLIAAALLALSLFLASQSPVVSSPTADVAQTSAGGEVTVKATWLANQATPTFAVVLDTHSVALDGYDLAKLATLRVDGREVAPTSWQAPAGGHHRSGTLVFPSTAADGTPLITVQTQAVDLVIRGVGGVPERTLTWGL